MLSAAKARRGFWLALVSAFALAVASVAAADVNENTIGANRSSIYIGVPGRGGVNISGTATDAGFMQKVANGHVPMCFSDSCVEITASQSPDGGTASLIAGQWYEVTVVGDGSGGVAGCWANGSPVAACTAKPRLKDGAVKPMSWPATYSVDAGANNGKSILYFLSASSTTMTAVFCPETACP